VWSAGSENTPPTDPPIPRQAVLAGQESVPPVARREAVGSDVHRVSELSDARSAFEGSVTDRKREGEVVIDVVGE
jgi:hypothetical protein